MRKQILILSGLILLAGAITLLGFETLQQDVVAPLLRLGDRVRFLVSILWRSQDKLLLWGLFLYIGILLALHTLMTIYSRSEEQERSPEIYTGPVSQWLRRLEALDEGIYYRWRFAQRIRSMAENKLSTRTGLSPEQTRNAIKKGDVDLPPEFLAYLRSAYSTEIKKYFSTYREDEGSNPIRDVGPDQILAYLEELMSN